MQFIVLLASEHTKIEHEGRSSDLLDGEERLGLHGTNLLGRLLRGGNYFWGAVSNCNEDSSITSRGNDFIPSRLGEGRGGGEMYVHPPNMVMG